METVLVVLGLVLLFCMTKRWFWLLAFGIGTLASAFATLASIVHFQILGALGFFFLTLILGAIASAIGSSYDKH